jgi:hypothetical protein
MLTIKCLIMDRGVGERGRMLLRQEEFDAILQSCDLAPFAAKYYNGQPRSEATCFVVESHPMDFE